MIDFRNLELLKQFAKETNPRVTVRKGSPLHDLMLTTMSGLLQQYDTDLEDAFGDGSGIDQYETLDEDRMDTLASNMLGYRRVGQVGTQTARILVDELDDYTFGEGELVAEDADGNEWYNSVTVSISSQQLGQNVDGLFYFIDVLFVSEEFTAGLELITSLLDSSQFSGFVSVTGTEGSLVDGITKETNEELFIRMSDGIASNNLVVGKGIERILGDEFKEVLREIYPIGMGDPEMMRDIPRDDDYVPIINLHLGGHTDAYVKSQKSSVFEKDFTAISRDTNKELSRRQPVQLNGAVNAYVGRHPLVAVDAIYNTANVAQPLGNFSIDTATGMISSTIGSSDRVFVEYRYTPIAVDIRAVPITGREDFTIDNLVFLRVSKVEELDPVTGAPSGVLLERNGGFGQGPFGMGPFGRGMEGDWSFNVLKPHERFSMLDESFIEFASEHYGKDIRVTYNAVPEIAPIHDFARSRGERTECGDTLVKNFIPVFVSGEIEVEVSASDSSAPTEDAIIERIESTIESHADSGSIDLDDIIQDLFDLGVKGINKGFEMSGEIHHTSGSIQTIKSTEKLTVPSPGLLKDTPRVISVNIARFYAGDITIIRTET